MDREDPPERDRLHESPYGPVTKHGVSPGYAGDAFLIHDGSGRILDANPKACESLGYSRDELLSMTIQDIDPAVIPSHINVMWGRVMRGEQVTFETQHRRKDGEAVPVEVTLGALSLPGGQTFLAVVRDLRERTYDDQAYQQLIDMMNDSAFVIDFGGKFLDVSRRALEVLGYSKDELLTMGPRDIDPYMAPEEIKELIEGIKSKERQVFRTQHRTKAGTIIPVEISSSHVTYQGQGAILSIARDITARTQAEESLRKIQSLLNATGRMAKVGGWEYDLQTESVTWTDEVYRIHGVSRDFQPTIETAMQFYPPDSKPRIADAVRRAIETGEGFDLEAPLRTAKGEERWVHSIGEAQVRDGRVVAISGTLQDITERREAEQALHDSQERFRGLSSMSTEGIMIHQAGVIVDANQAFAHIMGCEQAEDLIGKRGLETLPLTPESRQRVEAHISTNSSEVYEVELTTPDGSTLWAETSGREIVYRGQPARLVSMRDVTERKRAEADLRKSEEQLRQSQKMESVGRLAGGVAHDFNNMLGVILGHAELAMDQLDPHQPVFSNLLEIRNAANRSASITQQLLAFARRQVVAPTPLDVNRAVEGMLDMLRRLIGENIELLWLPGSNLGTVEVDPSQLDQVLVNLCANARDAVAGAGRVTIETAAVSLDADFCREHQGCVPGDYVLLSVSDDGVGISGEILEHLFEPFFTTKELGKGTGLGLATVYGIVKQNQGFIDVTSEVDAGTSVRIYLPRTEEAAVADDRRVTAETSQGAGETLLVVEDEPSVLRLAERMLTNLNYKVLTAQNPSKALSLAETYPGEIALLITDVIMPEMNGWELAERLRAVHPQLRTLYVSGYAAEVISGRGVLESGVHFLQKPFSTQELATGVKAALGQV